MRTFRLLEFRSVTQSAPAAGSYAPITTLEYQLEGDVFVCYDTLASLLVAYSSEAWNITNNLDKKVIGLIGSAVK
jgi:hypothetical protein